MRDIEVRAERHLLFLKVSDMSFFNMFMALLILAPGLPAGSSLPVMSGLIWPKMYPCGAAPVLPVRCLKSTTIHIFNRRPFLSPCPVSLIFMLTWLCLSPPLLATPTSSPLLTELPVGLRPFPCPPPRRQTAPPFWSIIGFPALVCQTCNGPLVFK